LIKYGTIENFLRLSDSLYLSAKWVRSGQWGLDDNEEIGWKLLFEGKELAVNAHQEYPTKLVLGYEVFEIQTLKADVKKFEENKYEVSFRQLLAGNYAGYDFRYRLEIDLRELMVDLHCEFKKDVN